MDPLLQDLRAALRSLTRSPLVSILAIACLGVGIGTNATMFSTVDASLIRPLPFAEPERLVTLQSSQPAAGIDETLVSYPDFIDWAEQSRTFERFAALSQRSLAFMDTEEPERVSGAVVSWALFSMLGIRPALGRDFIAADDRPGAAGVVLLSDELWRRRYNADPAAVGRTVTLNGQPHTIIGVLPERVKFPFNQVAWVPLAPVAYESPRSDRIFIVFGRMRPGIALVQAREEMTAIARRLERQDAEDVGWGVVVRPLRDFFMPEQVTLVVLTAMGAVTLVLLVACSNVANLLLARATARAREMSLRAALGAGRVRIVRQLLTEAIVLGLASAPLGIVLARVGMRLLDMGVARDDIPYLIEWRLDARTLVYTIAVAALTGIVFGLVPALHASKTNLNEALREGGRTGARGSRGRLRDALVVAQIALSLVLLVGASLFMRSFLNLQTRGGGFETTPLLTLRVFLTGDPYEAPDAKGRRVQDIIRRMEEAAGVERAAASNLVPLGGGGGVGAIVIDGQPADPGREPRIFYAGVTPRFFEALNVPVLLGRGFTDLEGDSRSGVALINVAMARRFWGTAAPGDPQRDAQTAFGGARELAGIDPIGRRFRFADEDTAFTVIGVVPDILTGGQASIVRPSFFVPYPYQETPNTGFIIRARSGNATSVTAAARAAIRSSDPTVPIFAVQTMEELRRFGFWEFQLFGWMFSIFGAIALALAGVGVYGVLAYAVSQRTQEFGVRVALGAQPGDVIALVLRHGVGLAALGILCGIAGAFGVTRLIATLLYNVTPTDPLSFGGVALFLTLVAVVASYLPARRAIRVDPVTALRAE